jgi:hypothetical protein
MAVHVHTHSARVGQDGTEFEASVHGAQRADGTWTGWLEFRSLRGNAPPLRTGQETSQPSLRALEYWAGGLERVYLEGALARARRNAQPSERNGPKRAPPRP